MYIYSKCYKIAIFSLLSYGYPMGIIWVSYGADSILIAKCECKGTTKNRNMQILEQIFEGCEDFEGAGEGDAVEGRGTGPAGFVGDMAGI